MKVATRAVTAICAVLVALGLAYSIGLYTGRSGATVVHVPGPVVTRTVPGPVTTKEATRTVKVDVPAPAVTVTVPGSSGVTPQCAAQIYDDWINGVAVGGLKWTAPACTFNDIDVISSAMPMPG